MPAGTLVASIVNVGREPIEILPVQAQRVASPGATAWWEVVPVGHARTLGAAGAHRDEDRSGRAPPAVLPSTASSAIRLAPGHGQRLADAVTTPPALDRGSYRLRLHYLVDARAVSAAAELASAPDTASDLPALELRSNWMRHEVR